MNQDIRLKAGALHHPKILQLRINLGPEAVLSLIDLWSFTAQYHPRGDLGPISDQALALAGNWPVERADEFRKELVKLRLVEEKRGSIRIHNWREHQGYVYHSPERSEQSRNAAKLRWKKRLGIHAESNADSNANRNATRSARRNAPSPAPVPAPDPDQNQDPPPTPRPRTNRAGGSAAGRPDPSIVGSKPPRPDPIDAIEIIAPPGYPANSDFEAFIAAYPPHRRKRIDAERAWLACNGSLPPLDHMLAALEEQKFWDDWRRDNGRYIPTAADWIINRQWERRQTEPF